MAADLSGDYNGDPVALLSVGGAISPQFQIAENQLTYHNELWIEEYYVIKVNKKQAFFAR